MATRRFPCLAIALFGLACTLTPITVQAASLTITSTVPADPADFQVSVAPPTSNGPAGSGSVLTYTVTYGSRLTYVTDMLIVRVRWDGAVRETLSGSRPVVRYVPGSASVASGGAQPVLDETARTLTWTIAPVLPIADRQVTFQLAVVDGWRDATPQAINLDANLYGPGVELAASTTISVGPSPAPDTTNQNPGRANPFAPGSNSGTGSNPAAPPSAGSASGPVAATPTIAQGSPSATIRPDRPDFADGSWPPLDAIADWPVIGPALAAIVAAVLPLARAGAAAPLDLIPVVGALGPLSNLANLVRVLPMARLPGLPGLLLAPFWWPRRRAWGVVYDAQTKLPIDPALVTLTDAAGHLRQAITDVYGRYQFLVGPGTYTLAVRHSHYAFPATSLPDRHGDGVYADLYLGGPIVVRQAGHIGVNIPLEPVAADWNQSAKRRWVSPPMRWGTVLARLFWVGLAAAAVMALLVPSPLNIGVVAIYALPLVYRLHRHWRAPWGVVRQPDGQPLAGAIVTLDDLDHPRVSRPPVVTDTTGRYAFLVDRGRYRVSVRRRDGYEAWTGPTVTVSGRYGSVHPDLRPWQRATGRRPGTVLQPVPRLDKSPIV